jgi:hypothetical protein
LCSDVCSKYSLRRKSTLATISIFLRLSCPFLDLGKARFAAQISSQKTYVSLDIGFINQSRSSNHL